MLLPELRIALGAEGAARRSGPRLVLASPAQSVLEAGLAPYPQYKSPQPAIRPAPAARSLRSTMEGVWLIRAGGFGMLCVVLRRPACVKPAFSWAGAADSIRPYLALRGSGCHAEVESCPPDATSAAAASPSGCWQHRCWWASRSFRSVLFMRQRAGGSGRFSSGTTSSNKSAVGQGKWVPGGAPRRAQVQQGRLAAVAGHRQPTAPSLHCRNSA